MKRIVILAAMILGCACAWSQAPTKMGPISTPSVQTPSGGSSSNCFKTDGSTGACGSGSGTVTVVGSGSLTSTALVTGGGSTTLQTPATTATMDSSGNISTPGTITAGTSTPTTIGPNGVLLNGIPALQSQTSLNNYYSGGSGNLTGTGGSNTANGFRHSPTPLAHTANGMRSLQTPLAAATPRMGSMRSSPNHHWLEQHREWVCSALFNTMAVKHREWVAANLTPLAYNTASGYEAGQYIADGVTANQTSSNSVYLGYQAYPLADGDTNEGVIGNSAIGHGSNTMGRGGGTPLNSIGRRSLLRVHGRGGRKVAAHQPDTRHNFLVASAGSAQKRQLLSHHQRLGRRSMHTDLRRGKSTLALYSQDNPSGG